MLSTAIPPRPVSLATHIHMGNRGSEGLAKLWEEGAAPPLATVPPAQPLGSSLLHKLLRTQGLEIAMAGPGLGWGHDEWSSGTSAGLS